MCERCYEMGRSCKNREAGHILIRYYAYSAMYSVSGDFHDKKCRFCKGSLGKSRDSFYRKSSCSAAPVPTLRFIIRQVVRSAMTDITIFAEVVTQRVQGVRTGRILWRSTSFNELACCKMDKILTEVGS